MSLARLLPLPREVPVAMLLRSTSAEYGTASSRSRASPWVEQRPRPTTRVACAAFAGYWIVRYRGRDAFWRGCCWLQVGRGYIVRMREIMLGLVILAVLCVGVTQASAGDAPPQVVCVSAVGPVDANGDGDTTPVESGDCP